uniref:uncharacterized protein LOC122605220 isoform X2 n=1 Tax=Erigeron canadensis TaxID=72917 RepID=UPI001CB94F1E|nr:uncharacterized protein LOC122605220 isoform X2 [Erigeron canadensis]
MKSHHAGVHLFSRNTHGGFGKVYKGEVIVGASHVAAAIKRLDLMSDQGGTEFWAEVEILSKLRHSHLVSLIGYCNHEREMILVYEYMSNGTLEAHLHKLRTRLSWIDRLKICIGAARGLDYLHTGTGIEFGVIHRDVKSSNILLHESWAAKISDFGLSKIGPTNQPRTYVNTCVKGTFGYLDPNYFATGKLTRKSDVYAFGVILFEVLCQKGPVDRSLEFGLAAWAKESIKEGNLKNIVDSDIRNEISPKCLKGFAKIAERCLEYHPKHRPTMTEVIFNLESILHSQVQTPGKSLFTRKVDVFHFNSTSENPALGQRILYLAEVNRGFGFSDIFKEPSKYAWSDIYEGHFIVPYHRIVVVTSKRVMLLLCLSPEKGDKRPCKIIWDVPWEDLMALEQAKAGSPKPSHLILHLTKFKRAESFVRVIKCSTEEESEGRDPQAVRICLAVRKMWKAYQASLTSQNHKSIAWNETDWTGSGSHSKSLLRLEDSLSPGSISDTGSFFKHIINFTKVWTSEQELRGRHTFLKKKVVEDHVICSIWRPICPDGYVSVGDIAHSGIHPPISAAVYQNTDRLFALPLGYDLVWRNCVDDYTTPVSIWRPRPPKGYVSAGCVAIPSFTEPELYLAYCIAESIAEETTSEEQQIWVAPDHYPWSCYIYKIRSPSHHFVGLRQPREEAAWKPMRVIDGFSRPSVSLLSEASSSASDH